MVFNSLEFIVFLSGVFILFWIFPKKARWLLLLVSSYYFYMYWNWKLVFLILFTTVVSFSSALVIGSSEKPGLRKTFLALGLILCFGVLVLFKYLPFFCDVYFDIVNLFKSGIVRGSFTTILPVGISFYTFQTSSYVIDVYRGKLEPSRNFFYYALYVIFFPQLVAGPIERFDNLYTQLTSLADKKIQDINFGEALRHMLLGFFKKIAVADIIGIFVNAVYENAGASNGPSAVLATLLFAVQIYCDFSGYCDIAVGCAKLFGISLTENFLSPYKSKSIKEFWNRWHITLSSWLKDYIYFPLGGSRVTKFRWVLNILTVFFISGLWHGASYTFIIWGLMHGALQVLGELTLDGRNNMLFGIGLNPEGRFVSGFRIFITFIFTDFSWIFFRADSLADAEIIILKIFTDWTIDGSLLTETMGILNLNMFSAVYIAVVVLLLPLLEKLKRPGESKFTDSGAVHFIASVLMTFSVLLSWIYLQASDIGSSFIYFQF